jgi:hypothetical protein
VDITLNRAKRAAAIGAVILFSAAAGFGAANTATQYQSDDSSMQQAAQKHTWKAPYQSIGRHLPWRATTEDVARHGAWKATTVDVSRHGAWKTTR